MHPVRFVLSDWKAAVLRREHQKSRCFSYRHQEYERGCMGNPQYVVFKTHFMRAEIHRVGTELRLLEVNVDGLFGKPKTDILPGPVLRDHVAASAALESWAAAQENLRRPHQEVVCPVLGFFRKRGAKPHPAAVR